MKSRGRPPSEWLRRRDIAACPEERFQRVRNRRMHAGFDIVADVSRQYPETIAPGIMNDVVDVTNGSLGKGIRDTPGEAAVRGSVNVNFVSRRIVEIFTPENLAVGHGGNV